MLFNIVVNEEKKGVRRALITDVLVEVLFILMENGVKSERYSGSRAGCESRV
jgi:hypothetical protein